jgi:hypothetical protein
MKRIVGLLIVCMVFSVSCSEKDVWNIAKSERKLFEMGVFMGQRAALEGKYVVGKDINGVYYWSANPYELDKSWKTYVDKGFNLDVSYTPQIEKQ